MIENDPYLPLFVPGNRSDRFSKAAAAGVSAIVIDLEDAVPMDARATAREAIRDFFVGGVTLASDCYVRVNASATPDHMLDLALLDALPPFVGVMLAKAETASEAQLLAERYPGRSIIGLIETPRGVAQVRTLARLFGRIAFGSIDYANAIGATDYDRSLLAARSEIVFACALADRPAPIDGATASIDSAATITRQTVRSRKLGFRGKLLIHPRQLIPVLQGMAPDADKVAEARRMVATVGRAAARFEGVLADAPVLRAAYRLIDEDQAIQLRIYDSRPS